MADGGTLLQGMFRGSGSFPIGSTHERLWMHVRPQTSNGTSDSGLDPNACSNGVCGMKYIITARGHWNIELQSRFGECGSTHLLSDKEVVDAIVQFGRAEIKDDEYDQTCRHLEFQNDYD